jgi:flagellar biosynthetic protein FliR
MDLEAFANAEVWKVLLTFARIGTALMILPGFGEHSFPAQVRLLFALTLSAALSNNLTGIDGPPHDFGLFIGQIASECFVGFFLGSMARVIIFGVHFAGQLIANMTGFANAMSSGTATSFEGENVVSAGLMMTATAVIFFSDIHLLAVESLAKSYILIPAGHLPDLADFAKQSTQVMSDTLMMGLRLAMPFLILGVIVNGGLGLINRMMPNLPVFFVASPLLLAFGLILLMATVSAVVMVFGDHLANWFQTLGV